jgi:hypothetical protein
MGIPTGLLRFFSPSSLTLAILLLPGSWKDVCPQSLERLQPEFGSLVIASAGRIGGFGRDADEHD